MTETGYKVTRTTMTANVSMVLGLLLLVALICAPWWAGRADMRLMSELFLYLALASLWNLMAGYAGLVSVGQQAYVGFGGYMLFALTMLGGLHPLAAIALAGVLGALISLPVASLIFKLRGAYFAIGTWAIAEVFRLSFAQVSALGGGSGTSLPVSIVKSLASSRQARESLSYWLALGSVVLILLSDTGRSGYGLPDGPWSDSNRYYAKGTERCMGFCPPALRYPGFSTGLSIAANQHQKY